MCKEITNMGSQKDELREFLTEKNIQQYPTFRIIGSNESPISKGVEIILPDGQEIGKYFPVTDAKIETGTDKINLVTISFYAKLPE